MLDTLHFISGYTFYLGLIFDGFSKYEDIGDFELEIVTDIPNFDVWDKIKYHKGGDILKIEVRCMLRLFIIFC